MKAIIMAGGQGNRLRPITCNIPKPMVTVLSKPTLAYIVELLKKHGITEIGITLQYLPEVIMDYFGDGSGFGVNISYFIEETPLGTAGSVKSAADFLGSDAFLVISGDCISDICLKNAIAFHKEKEADVTIVLSEVENPTEYGVVLQRADGAIERFIEKPLWAQVYSNRVNTGIYIIEKSVMDLVPSGCFYDFSKDLFPRMMGMGKKMFGFVSGGYWCDVGDSAAYLQCHKDILTGHLEDVFIKEHKFQGVSIISPCFIGKRVEIGQGCVIGPYAVLEDGVTIGENTKVAHSIIHENCRISPCCKVKGSILCRGTKVGLRTRLFEGSVVGYHCTIGQGCEIMPDVKIWPQKQIQEDECVKENFVWGSNSDVLNFEHGALTGEFNVSITPELCSKLGAVLGNFAANGGVIVCDDNHHGSRLLKNSLSGGVLAGGGKVWDIGFGTWGIAAYSVKSANAPYGIYIYQEDGDVTIKIINIEGACPNRYEMRKIVAAYEKGDFKRVRLWDIDVCVEIYGMEQRYVEELKGKFALEKGGVIGWSGDHTIESKCLRLLLYHLGYETITPQQAKEKQLPAILCKKKALQVVDEEGETIKDIGLMSLLYGFYMDMIPTEVVEVPAVSPMFLLEMGKKKGKQVVYGAEGADFMEDSLFCGALLLKGIQNGASFVQLKKEIPACYMMQGAVRCSKKDKARVMGEMSKLQNGNNGGDGIGIEEDGGRVVIMPSGVKAHFKIYAQAASFEVAQELCAAYVKKVSFVVAGKKGKEGL